MRRSTRSIDSNVDFISNRSTLVVNDVPICHRKLQQTLPSPAMLKLKASLGNVVVLHVFKCLLHCRLYGLRFRRRVAMAPRSRVLVTRFVDISRDNVARMTVGLVFDQCGNVSGYGGNS